MEVRLATLDDFEQFLQIKEEFYKEYGVSKKTKEFIFSEFKEYLRYAIFIAKEEGKIIGYLCGIIEENPYEIYGNMGEAFVKKEYRNKGINLCRLDVNPDNPAQDVYKKWGFKIDKYRMSLKI